jgi:hypothetical protein
VKRLKFFVALTAFVERVRTRDQNKTHRFYEMLLKRSEEAKKHPEKLIPIEDVK